MATVIPMFNLLLESDLLKNALIAGTISAILAGIVGYFVVLRQLAFAGHALGHIGFAGATGAGLIGLSAGTGQLILTVLSAIGLGILGDRVNKSDISTGVVLAFFLGLGILFLQLYTAFAAQAMSILFGNLLGVSADLIKTMLVCTLVSLFLLSIIARPLLFSSLEPELAQAKGISLRIVFTIFMIVVGIAVAEVSQVVGILLVFTLLIGPPGAALNWTKTVASGLILTLFLGILTVWLGIIFSFITNWPIPFFICSLSLLIYLLSLIAAPKKRIFCKLIA